MDKIKTLVGGLKGKTIGVLGLAFKPNTDDIRESPAMDIVRAMMEAGARVKAFDPAGMDNAREVLPDIEFRNDPCDGAVGSDALVILTEWNQFRKLDLTRLKGLLSSPKVVDLRNIYDPLTMRNLGFEYVCVGRGGNLDTPTGAVDKPTPVSTPAVV